MRIQCQSSIQPISASKKVKKCRSSIVIGLEKAVSGKENEHSLILTVSTGKSGAPSVFKISTIKKVIQNFISNGKLTVEFSSPNCFLLISEADPANLSIFTNLLLKSWKEPNSGLKLAQISPRKPAKRKFLEPKQLELSIQQRKDYPFIKGFPSDLHSLKINNSELDRFDPRWLKLTDLVGLDLAKNQLYKCKEKLNFAPLKKLRYLSLAEKNLAGLPSTFWTGLTKINSLISLDLSENRIESLDRQLYTLKTVQTLNISGNPIKNLYPEIRQMKKLSNLHLNRTDIGYLPLEICRLPNLAILTIEDCPNLQTFFPDPFEALSRQNTVPGMSEVAASRILDSLPVKFRDSELALSVVSLLPRELVVFLRVDFQPCSICGRNVVADRSYPVSRKLKLGTRVAVLKDFDLGGGVFVQPDCCSAHCVGYFMENYFTIFD